MYFFSMSKMLMELVGQLSDQKDEFFVRLSYVVEVYHVHLNSLTAKIFTVFGHSLLEDRVLHKEA